MVAQVSWVHERFVADVTNERFDVLVLVDVVFELVVVFKRFATFRADKRFGFLFFVASLSRNIFLCTSTKFTYKHFFKSRWCKYPFEEVFIRSGIIYPEIGTEIIYQYKNRTPVLIGMSPSQPTTQPITTDTMLNWIRDWYRTDISDWISLCVNKAEQWPLFLLIKLPYFFQDFQTFSPDTHKFIFLILNSKKLL